MDLFVDISEAIITMVKIMESFIFKYWMYILLLIIAIWEEFCRERRGREFKRIFTQFEKFGFWQGIIAFLQRILDWIFNKFMIRQLLNPYFFFPFSIILTFVLYNKIKSVDGNIQSVILFITFLAIMWYARETHALRSEQKKSNEISRESNEILKGRPLVVIAKENGDYISVKNTGNNIARDIILLLKRENKLLKGIRFLVLGINEKIAYGIEKNIVDLIDNCDDKIQTEIYYWDFQKGKSYLTTFRLDEKIFIESGIGRFNIVEDGPYNGNIPSSFY